MWLKGRRYSEIPKPIIVIFSLLVVPASMILAIIADFNLHGGRWPFLASILATVVGVFLAFLALGLPVVPPPPTRRRLYILADRGFVVLAALPALFLGTNLIFRYPDKSTTYLLRMLLVVAAMIVGIYVKNLDAGESQPSSKVRLLDSVRQIVLAAVIFYGVLVYIFAPTFW